MNDAQFNELLADRGQLSAARRLPLSLMAAIAAAAGAPLPGVHVDGPWRRDPTGLFGRSDLAPARVAARLTTRRPTPIELELAPWSDHECELVVRPPSRSPHRWSARRRTRWYADAHAVADVLRQHFVARSHPQPLLAMQVTARDRRAG
ncbi:MAG: hypothetical protein ACT4OX_03935 [Actinomycetota bacterium]